MKRMSCDKSIVGKHYKCLISVVIPVYNVERYLCECVDSVLNQTYSNLEILLIDDGSTDLSGQICDNYSSVDSRIHVFHQVNRGLGNARNLGMRKATGKYIIFLDSDDYWKNKNAIKGLCQKAEKDNLQVVVFSAKAFCDGINNQIKLKYSHNVQNYLVKNGLDSLAYAQKYGEYYAQACLRFYRLDYLKSNDFTFDEGIIHEDESFSFLSYIKADRVMCIGERYYMRRYRPGSIMMSLDPFQSAHGYSVAANTLLYYAKSHGLNNKEKKLFYKQLISLISGIYCRYNEANDNKQRIISDTWPTIKKSIDSGLFPFYYYFVFSDFKRGYFYWSIRSFLRGMINMYK